MNEKELLVYNLIKENPYLSQQEMAEQLQMSRPAVANTISSLIKKGEIIGRAYVLPQKNRIIAIGGANVDRKFHIEGNVQLGTSNPSSVTESVGGVARNIAENLSRLDNEVKLLTTIGQDHDAAFIEQASANYIDFSLVEKLPQSATGSYTAVLNNDGDLVIAMANMAIYNLLLPELIEKHEATIVNANCIIVDLNCPKETVVYLQQLCKVRNIPLVIVPVSSPKMEHMPDDLQGVTYFICNRDEAETYLNMQLNGMDDCKEAVRQLLAHGAQHVVLTLGEQGVIAGHNSSVTHYDAHPVEQIIDVTGAGDAFVSGLMHGVLNNESFEQSIQLGLVNAAYTLQSDNTVRIDLTREQLKTWRKQ